MGSEHAVFDDTGAHEYFSGEIRNLGDDPREHLADAISLNSKMSRVHLRSFMRVNKV